MKPSPASGCEGGDATLGVLSSRPLEQLRYSQSTATLHGSQVCPQGYEQCRAEGCSRIYGYSHLPHPTCTLALFPSQEAEQEALALPMVVLSH